MIDPIPPGSRSDWFTSSHSESNAHCVEVRLSGATVEVRDSKDPDGAVLRFTSRQWSHWLAELAK